MSFAVTLLGTSLAVVVGHLCADRLGTPCAPIALFLTVAACSRWCGVGAGIVAALAGATASYVLATYRAPAPFSIGDGISVLALIGVSVLIGRLGNALDAARAEARERERHLRDQHERNQQQQAFIEAATSSFGLGVFAVDAEGTFTFFNPAAAALLGWEHEELLGRKAYPVLLAATAQTADPLSARGLLAAVESAPGSVVLVRKGGQSFPATVTAAPLQRNGETLGAVVLFRDDSEQQALQARLLEQAFHDSVTGLPNRALFLNRLEQAIRSLGRGREALAVLFLDLDHFKSVNDSMGHAAGDELLRAVGARFQECLRKGDTLARFGGDEFTALLVGVRGAAVTRHVAQRFLKQMERPFVINGREIGVSVSIGVAIGDVPTATPEDFLREADAALYRAKRSGRGQFVIVDDALHGTVRPRSAVKGALLGALERGELRVFYQPEVDLENGRIIGVEALVRWQHPERGLLTPAEFLPAAEDSGQIFAVGQWVRREACRQVAEWNTRRDGKSELAVSINLSTQEMMHPELLTGLAQMFTDTSMDPGNVRIEISESVLIEHPLLVERLLPALKALRLQVLVDDFGAGYASVGCLRRFQLDGLKMDRSFVTELSRSGSLLQWAHAVVELSRLLHLSVSAEGVELAEQRDQLRAAGFSRGQGYFFSPPAEAAGISRLLT